MRFACSADVASAPDKVFRLATDIDRFGEWMPGFVRVERLTEGPTRAGSKWRETRKMFGHEATEEFEVTAIDAPRSLDLFVDGTKGSTKKGEFRFRHLFQPSPAGGTRIVLSGEVSKMGCAGSVFGFLFGGMFRKMVAKDLAALKVWIEKQP
jgi:carbon monoxide dehydrogenase subunit G